MFFNLKSTSPSSDSYSYNNKTTNPVSNQEVRTPYAAGTSQANFMQLQQTIGNQSLQRMVNKKATSKHSRVKSILQREENLDATLLSDQREKQTSSLSVEEILSEEPSSAERTRDEMEQDIRMAQMTVKKIMDQCSSLDELSSYFQLLRLRFRLKDIAYKDLGTPNAQVHLEINPKAACLFPTNNQYTLNYGENYDLTAKQEVTFKTSQSRLGHMWGTEMIAQKLGPNHPQGFGPIEQRPLMRNLPTNRAKHPSLENRYIRGHLLNDNLGGPGLAQNLFPITERANKDHHDRVEFFVKDWVNKLGYFVFYKVKIENIVENIDPTLFDDAQNFVDAELHCEAYPISLNGKRANTDHYINTIIKSEFGQNNGFVDQGETTPKGTDGVDKSHQKIARNGWVEVSVTKNKGAKGYDSVNAEVADGIMEFYDTVKEYLKPETIMSMLSTEIGKTLGKGMGVNLSEVLKSILYDSTGEKWKIFDIQNSKFGQVSTWNGITNKLAKENNAIADLLEQLTNIVDLYKDLTNDEIEMMAKDSKMRSNLLLAKLLSNFTTAENYIRSVKQQWYKNGWEEAQKSGNNNFDSLSFREGYMDYVNGFRCAQSGHDCNYNSDGFIIGYEDYLSGLSNAQQGNLLNIYYVQKVAEEEYETGWKDAQQNNMNNLYEKAYIQGYNEYIAGALDAFWNNGQNYNEVAYVRGFQDHTMTNTEQNQDMNIEQDYI